MKKFFKKYLNVKLLLLLLGVVIAKVVVNKLFQTQNDVKVFSNTDLKTSTGAKANAGARVEVTLKGKDIIDVIDKSFKNKVKNL